MCFVYDPAGVIANPRGVESDLSRDANAFPVRVLIRSYETRPRCSQRSSASTVLPSSSSGDSKYADAMAPDVAKS